MRKTQKQTDYFKTMLEDTQKLNAQLKVQLFEVQAENNRMKDQLAEVKECADLKYMVNRIFDKPEVEFKDAQNGKAKKGKGP